MVKFLVRKIKKTRFFQGVEFKIKQSNNKTINKNNKLIKLQKHR